MTDVQRRQALIADTLNMSLNEMREAALCMTCEQPREQLVCLWCHGRGTVRLRKRAYNGTILATVEQTCPDCEGKGVLLCLCAGPLPPLAPERGGGG